MSTNQRQSDLAVVSTQRPRRNRFSSSNRSNYGRTVYRGSRNSKNNRNFRSKNNNRFFNDRRSKVNNDNYLMAFSRRPIPVMTVTSSTDYLQKSLANMAFNVPTMLTNYCKIIFGKDIGSETFYMPGLRQQSQKSQKKTITSEIIIKPDSSQADYFINPDFIMTTSVSQFLADNMYYSMGVTYKDSKVYDILAPAYDDKNAMQYRTIAAKIACTDANFETHFCRFVLYPTIYSSKTSGEPQNQTAGPNADIKTQVDQKVILNGRFLNQKMEVWYLSNIKSLDMVGSFDGSKAILTGEPIAQEKLTKLENFYKSSSESGFEDKETFASLAYNIVKASNESLGLDRKKGNTFLHVKVTDISQQTKMTVTRVVHLIENEAIGNASNQIRVSMDDLKVVDAITRLRSIFYFLNLAEVLDALTQPNSVVYYNLSPKEQMNVRVIMGNRRLADRILSLLLRIGGS